MHAQLAGADSLRLLRAPRALFVYARGAGLINVSGTGTAAELVMELAGAQNAVTEFKGFKPLTAEAVVTSAPEVVIIPERGLRSLGGKDELFNQPGLAQTPAGRARLVIAVDDALLLGLGPRIGEGVKTLARELHAAFDLQEQP
jgi:iron complex transport system substrate-binding protein